MNAPAGTRSIRRTQTYRPKNNNSNDNIFYDAEDTKPASYNRFNGKNPSTDNNGNVHYNAYSYFPNQASDGINAMARRRQILDRRVNEKNGRQQVNVYTVYRKNAPVNNRRIQKGNSNSNSYSSKWLIPSETWSGTPASSRSSSNSQSNNIQSNSNGSKRVYKFIIMPPGGMRLNDDRNLNDINAKLLPSSLRALVRSYQSKYPIMLPAASRSIYGTNNVTVSYDSNTSFITIAVRTSKRLDTGSIASLQRDLTREMSGEWAQKLNKLTEGRLRLPAPLLRARNTRNTTTAQAAVQYVQYMSQSQI
jgi:hypothetical protein